MRSERDADVLTLIEGLNSSVKLARKHSLHHTAHLLQVTLLELKTILYEISDDELKQFSELLDDEISKHKPKRLC